MKPTVTLTFENVAAMIAYFGPDSGTGPANVEVINSPVTNVVSIPSVEEIPSAASGQATPTVDKNGLPWDERIHAPSKATKADGSWRMKQKLDATFVAQVEAELRANAPAVAQAVAPPMPPVDQTPAVAPTVAQAVAPPMPPVDQTPAVAPPMPQTQPAVQAPVAHAEMAPVAQQPAVQAPVVQQTMDYGAFMSHFQTKMGERDANGSPLINASYLTALAGEIAQAHNTPLSAFTDIASHPHMIPYTVQLLQRDGKW